MTQLCRMLIFNIPGYRNLFCDFSVSVLQPNNFCTVYSNLSATGRKTYCNDTSLESKTDMSRNLLLLHTVMHFYLDKCCMSKLPFVLLNMSCEEITCMCDNPWRVPIHKSKNMKTNYMISANVKIYMKYIVETSHCSQQRPSCAPWH